jgi:hypothetical protein
MVLRELRDRRVGPFDGGPLGAGHRWAAGPYEWHTAVAAFAVDPEAAVNDGITDLSSAPRDPDGTVTFDADLRMLRPRNGGNGKLLLVVPNRGNLGGVPFSVDAPFLFGSGELPHPGDGLLLDAGWTIAWCGWQWDVLRGPGLLGLTAPEAAVEPGLMRLEFRPDALTLTHPLSDSSLMFTFADYPAANVDNPDDDPDVVLYERVAPDADPEPIARERWRFSDATTVMLEDGFQPFHWYTLIYRTARAPVTGTGLLAVRDAVSYLRDAHELTQAYGFGVSQSGRFLRQFLAEGRNLDEDGRIVFDGVFAHIAGARMGEFNHRYAQPSLTHPIGFSNLPPYDTSGLLATQRARGGAPKLILTNSAWEYWRGDGALVHADPATGADLPDDPDARVYLLRGTDHIGAMPLKDAMPVANPVHALDPQPLLRALFIALDEWVSTGTAPPPSAVPRSDDATATSREAVLARFASVPGVLLPDPEALNVTRSIDLGEGTAAGVGEWPLMLGERKPALVSDIDAGGNERAGIALPAVAVPVAAYTGWNPRRPVPGLPDVLYEFVGSRLPLLTGPVTAPRDDYERAVRAAAQELVERRLLLEIDVPRTVSEALRLYDARSE